MGVVDLGPLPNVEHFKASADLINPRDFSLAILRPTWPTAYHALSGKPIEAVWNTSDGAEIGPQKLGPNGRPFPRISLIEFRGGVVSANHPDKVSVEGGLVKVKGLEPGTYRLTDHWSGHSMSISVVKGDQQEDTLVGQSKLLETNRVRPVHVKDLKLTDDKLVVHVGNFDKFTRVHIVADAYEPLIVQGASFPVPAFPILASPRMRIPSFYINSLKLDEEYQYVLQRQFYKKYLGNLLPQPSAILNPWELAVTQNATQSAAGGDPMDAMAPKLAAPGAAERLAENSYQMTLDSSPEYEFLRRGCVVLTNGRCDDKGTLSIDRKAFLGMTCVTVIVVHPSGYTFRILHLPLNESRELTDRRLAKAFSAEDRLTEIQSVRILPKSDKTDLGDAVSTRVKVYSSIP
ncbi:MAG TPA: hypothetical protein VM260_11400, partial [Pirellula sp.]|nr:hypothetical protein [Pirellula sp.]